MTFLLISLLGACCLLSFTMGMLVEYARVRDLISKQHELLDGAMKNWKECLELLQALAEDTGRIPKKDGSLVSPFTVKPNDN